MSTGPKYRQRNNSNNRILLCTFVFSQISQVSRDHVTSYLRSAKSFCHNILILYIYSESPLKTEQMLFLTYTLKIDRS